MRPPRERAEAKPAIRTQNHEGRPGPGCYLKEAASWDADRVAMQERSARIAWRIAALAHGTSGALAS